MTTLCTMAESCCDIKLHFLGSVNNITHAVITIPLGDGERVLFIILPVDIANAIYLSSHLFHAFRHMQLYL